MKILSEIATQVIEHGDDTYERTGPEQWCRRIGERTEPLSRENTLSLEWQYQACAAAVSARPANQERSPWNWIPVDEAVPIPAERVLVFDPGIPRFKSIEGRIRSFTHIEIGYTRTPDSIFDGWYVPNGSGAPTHWMPLPSYPKGIEIPGMVESTSDSLAFGCDVSGRQVGQSRQVRQHWRLSCQRPKDGDS